MTCIRRAMRGAAVLGAITAIALSMPAHAQSATDLRTMADFIECKLSPKQIERFIARVDANAVPGLTNQSGKPDAIALGWQTRKPVEAWGVQSRVVTLVSPREMLMAIAAPKGGEIDVGKQWAERIGGMREDAGAVSMREHMNWRGADYRKAGGGREIRLLVDQKETPGWILLGCRYDQASFDNF
ncbi:hypothetical protein V4C53_34790 [Paraburkholderia azotifigens]|uniref:hypothetical protein n=1 Tax=Paraburkholderia azotifigens TaxID=2057004 RepID=UPI00317995E3